MFGTQAQGSFPFKGKDKMGMVRHRCVPIPHPLPASPLKGEVFVHVPTALCGILFTANDEPALVLRATSGAPLSPSRQAFDIAPCYVFNPLTIFNIPLVKILPIMKQKRGRQCLSRYKSFDGQERGRTIDGDAPNAPAGAGFPVISAIF